MGAKVSDPWMVMQSLLELTRSNRQLGLELKGDSANVYWGAFDAIIKTDVSKLSSCEHRFDF